MVRHSIDNEGSILQSANNDSIVEAVVFGSRPVILGAL